MGLVQVGMAKGLLLDSSIREDIKVLTNYVNQFQAIKVVTFC
jgi:hypothetical protein